MSDPYVWYEVGCPECGAQNMADQDSEVCECWKCSTCFEIVDDAIQDDDLFDDLCDMAEVGRLPPQEYEKFEELPIVFEETERDGDWRRTVKRTGTIKELLKIWDIDDEYETSEIVQVLRHLKRIMTI